MKNNRIKLVFLSVMLCISILFLALVIGTFLFHNKTQPKLKTTNKAAKLSEIENINQYNYKNIDKEKIVFSLKKTDFSQYVKAPSNAKEKIKPGKKDSKRNRATFIKAEDMGEDFSTFTTEKTLSKLKSGNKIEQRKVHPMVKFLLQHFPTQQPGYVWSRAAAQGSGHCGIMDYNGRIISAQEHFVTRVGTLRNGDILRIH